MKLGMISWTGCKTMRNNQFTRLEKWRITNIQSMPSSCNELHLLRFLCSNFKSNICIKKNRPPKQVSLPSKARRILKDRVSRSYSPFQSPKKNDVKSFQSYRETQAHAIRMFEARSRETCSPEPRDTGTAGKRSGARRV